MKSKRDDELHRILIQVRHEGMKYAVAMDKIKALLKPKSRRRYE